MNKKERNEESKKNKEFFEKFTDLDIDFSNLHFVISYDMAKGTN